MGNFSGSGTCPWPVTELNAPGGLTKGKKWAAG